MQTVASTQPTILSTHSAATIISPQAGTRSSTYLPSPFHPFGHPEFLCKNPFLPYDLASLRGVSMNGRPMHHIQHNTSLTSESSTISNQTPEHLSTSRLSPTSSRPSSSSPPSSAHSEIKMNITIEMNESDDSDDEQIDVVKSAFVPILRPNPSAQSIVGVADSTTITDQMDTSSAPRVRCDLKAPSSRKSGMHETAPTGPRSPETKIKSPISAQKTVWRPY